LDAYLEGDSRQLGYIYISFNTENFIQPVSYTKSVTNFVARFERLQRLQRPGESFDEYPQNYVPPEPVLKSKVTFPGRFIISGTFAGSPHAVSSSNGESELSWDGPGMTYFDDMDHLEQKDFVILFQGILLATGLAMLAKLACKIAELVADTRS
jgi:hypothetical protein